MKKLFVLLLIFVLMSAVPVSIAQQHDAFPDCTLDMKKMVEILADYDVEHQRKIAAGAYWGLTDFREQVIYIDSSAESAIRRLTVLHEMLHICYNAKGVDTADGIGEKVVEIKATNLYLKLYGEDQ